MKKYFSLVTFSHTIFAMPFAMIGFFLAVWKDGYHFYWSTFFLVLACMIFARSAAMAFNRIADVKFDRENPRTANREIPKGIISKNSAIIFTVICCVGFVVSAYFINRLCFYLSPVAIAVILGYSYTKRFTSLSHFILGLGLSLAPVGAFIAVAGHFALLPVLFGAAVFTWVSGFDIIYSLQDEDFDVTHNLYSVPAKLGSKNALIVSSLVHASTATILLFAGYLGNFSWWYWIGFLVFIAMLIYQHSLVRHDDLSKVNRAFATANGFASIVFACFVLIDIY